MYSSNTSVAVNGTDLKTIATSLSGTDVSYLFDRSDTRTFFPSCVGVNHRYASVNLCANTTAAVAQPCTFGVLNNATTQALNIQKTLNYVGYSWQQVASYANYLVIDGKVLNLTPYILAFPNGVPGDEIDTALRQVIISQDAASGKDASRLFRNRKVLNDALPCLVERFNVGKIDRITPGCFASQLFLYVSLVVILGIVLARFAMACIFTWFLSRKLVRPPKNLKRHVVSPAVLPEGANIEVNNKTGTAPWTHAKSTAVANGASKLARTANGRANGGLSEKPTIKKSVAPVDADGMINMASIGAELFCVCLVTAYSEGADGLKTTLDSIAGTSYSDARKLLFVVCDGIVTGSGEKMSTPDICVSLLDRDPRFGTGDPTPMSYLAVASGKKAHNQALVYAGHYSKSCPQSSQHQLKDLCSALERAPHTYDSSGQGRRTRRGEGQEAWQPWQARQSDGSYELLQPRHLQRSDVSS